MDKKRLLKNLQPDDLKGFEEFVEGEPSDSSFLPRPQGASGNKKETSFEHFTFLTTDAERLTKLNRLLTEKLPFISKFEQGNALIKEQRDEVTSLQQAIFIECDLEGSAYRKSISEIFDSFFGPHDPRT